MLLSYLATLLVGATLGALAQLWWTDYLDDTRDLRSVRRYDDARRCGNRWL